MIAPPDLPVSDIARRMRSALLDFMRNETNSNVSSSTISPNAALL